MSMSGSPQQQLKGREIPSKRFILNDLAQLPHDYSTTPGGTIFSTTPGALLVIDQKSLYAMAHRTRILYDRSFLLQCRNSPLTKSPPPNMAKIPGVTAPGEVDMPKENGEAKENHGDKTTTETTNEDEAQFEMDI